MWLKRSDIQRRQRGVNLVEAALVTTIFLMVMFGIVGFGRAIWAYSWTSHAAREATRWASVRGQDGATVASATDVENYVKANMLGLDSNQVTVTTNWTPDNLPGSSVEVRVQYNLTRLVPWVPAMNLESTSRMTIAQ